MQYKRTFFTLKNDGVEFLSFKIMTDFFRDVHIIKAFLWTEDYTLCHCTFFIVCIHAKLAQQHKRLVFRRMTVYLNRRSQLHNIQEGDYLIL